MGPRRLVPLLVALLCCLFASALASPSVVYSQTWPAPIVPSSLSSSSPSSSSSEVLAERLSAFLPFLAKVSDPSMSDLSLELRAPLLFDLWVDYQTVLEHLAARRRSPYDRSPFPEESSLPRNQGTDGTRSSNKTNSAIMFSGGGSRSFIASVGHAHALHDLGLLSKAKYATGISGGNWFLQSYSYRSPDVKPGDAFGDVLPPEECTLDRLLVIRGKSNMRAFTGVVLSLDILKNVVLGKSIIDSWVRGVYDTYLKPAGVKFGAPPSWDLVSASSVAASNPSLALSPSDFNLVADPVNDPFPLVGVSLLGPLDASPYGPFRGRNFVMLEVSPLAVGVAVGKNITYSSRPGTDGLRDNKVTLKLGGYVDAPFFDSLPSSSSSSPSSSSSSSPAKAKGGEEADRRSLAMEDPALQALTLSDKGMWTVEKSCAASSLAPAAFITLTTRGLNDALGFKSQYYSPSVSDDGTAAVSPPSDSPTVLLGDGGDLENTGLMSALQRGVDRLVMFANNHLPLASAFEYDPTSRIPTLADVDLLPSFFGIPLLQYGSVEEIVASFGEDYSRNKVFEARQFAPLISALQAAAETGNGAVATATLTTVDNEWWGIVGGVQVELTVAYLSRVYNFEDKLPEETKKQAVVEGSRDPEVLIPDGDFKGFPHYETKGAEIYSRAANLLANAMYFEVMANEALFRAALE